MKRCDFRGPAVQPGLHHSFHWRGRGLDDSFGRDTHFRAQESLIKFLHARSGTALSGAQDCRRLEEPEQLTTPPASPKLTTPDPD